MLPTARSISEVRSYATSSSTPSGSPGAISSSRALTSRITRRVSAPGRTTTIPPTVSPSPFHSASPRRPSGPRLTLATSSSRIGVPSGPTPSPMRRMSSTDRMYPSPRIMNSFSPTSISPPPTSLLLS